MINDVQTRFAVSRRAILRRGGFTLVELLICLALVFMLIAILLPAIRRSVEAGRQITCLNHLRQITQATLQYCSDNEGVFPSAAASDTPTPNTYDWIYWRRAMPAPFNDTSRSAIGRYIGRDASQVFRCPADQWDARPPNQWSTVPYPFSYSMNAWIGQNVSLNNRWLHVHDIVNSSEVILFIDEDSKSIDDGAWLPTLNNLHNEVSNRHDTAHDGTDPSGGVSYDANSRGNVVFCDGHGEFVSRQFSWDVHHFQPTNRPLPNGFY